MEVNWVKPSALGSSMGYFNTAGCALVRQKPWYTGAAALPVS
jgi:hypothetical protein